MLPKDRRPPAEQKDRMQRICTFRNRMGANSHFCLLAERVLRVLGVFETRLAIRAYAMVSISAAMWGLWCNSYEVHKRFYARIGALWSRG